MKNAKILGVLLVLTAVVVVISSSATAYMRKQSTVTEVTLTPAVVSCEVREQYTSPNKTSIKVANTSNIDVYVRVKLVSYWVNSDGEIVLQKPDDIVFDYNNSSWVKHGDCYYYTKKVTAKQGDIATVTPDDLLKSGSVITLKTMVANNTTLYQAIDILAEAIQADPETAVESAWDVNVVNGVIQ